MTDFLVGFLAFLVFQQAATLGLAPLFRRAHGRGWFLLPILVGAAALAASLVPHYAGSIHGRGHSPSDVDASRPGAPDPWVLALVAVVAARFLDRTLRESALSIHLRSISRPAAGGIAVGRLALRVHESESFRGPFVRGLLRPTVYLHRGMIEELSTASLRAVCLHEARHAQRGDHLVAWLHSLVVRPLDFLRSLGPCHAAWLDRAEHECDDHAAGVLGSRFLVAQAIVDVLRFIEGRPAVAPAGPGFLAAAGSIRRRVERLLADAPVPDGGARSEAASAMIGAILPLAIAGALVTGLGLEFYCLLEHVVGAHCVP